MELPEKYKKKFDFPSEGPSSGKLHAVIASNLFFQVVACHIGQGRIFIFFKRGGKISSMPVKTGYPR
jgi:RecJ-like exonuclease